MFDDLFTSTTAPTAPAKGGMFSGLFAGTPKAKAPAAPATPPATPWSTPSTTATGDWTRAQPMSIAPKPATPPAPKDNMFKDIWSGVKGAVGGYVSSEKQFLGQQYQGAKQFTQHPVESVHAADAAAYAAADVAAYAAAHAADKQDWAQTEQDSMNDAKAREIAKKIAAKQPITGDEMKIYQESTQRQKEMMDKLTMEAMGAEAGGYRDIEQEAISRAKSILGKAISKYKPPPEMGELEPEATRLEMGAGKQAIMSMLGTKTADEAYGVLKGFGVADDIAKMYAPIVAKTTKETEMMKIASAIEKAQNTTVTQGIAKDLEPLAQEARKYGSAEEFVKAQGETVYRGGKKLDVSKINEEGLPVTYDNKIAEQFARSKNQFAESPAGQIMGYQKGQNIVENYQLSSNARIATRSDIPDNIFNAYKQANPLTKPEIAEPIITKWAKENGFDAIDFRTLGKTSAKEAEIKILNPEVIKTKSQLTDIWNKANQKTATEAGTVKTFTVYDERVLPTAKSKLAEKGNTILGTAKIKDSRGENVWKIKYQENPSEIKSTEASQKIPVKETSPELKASTTLENAIKSPESKSAIEKSKLATPAEMGELEPEATRLEMGAKPTPDIPKPTPKAGTELPPPTGQPASWWAKNTQPLSQIPTPVLEQRLEQKISAQEGNQIRMELERRAKPTTTLKPTEGTGMPKPRGLSVGVEQNAVERKLTQGFGDLPEYKTVNMADQAAKATNLLATDAERAKNIAMGLEQPPSGVLPESVYIAVENKATLAGDTETLRDLATKSSLPEQATTMGQRIRTLGERDDLSPVSKIKEVQTSRTEASAKKLGSKAAKTKVDIVNGIKSEIQKVSSKMTWEDFAKSITCPV